MCFPGLCQINSAFTVPSTLENFQIWDQAAVLQDEVFYLTKRLTLAHFPSASVDY